MTTVPFHRVARNAAALLVTVLVTFGFNKLSGAVDDGVSAPTNLDPYSEQPLPMSGVGSVGSNSTNGSPLRYWMDPYLRTIAYVQNGLSNNGADGWERQYQAPFFTTLRITKDQQIGPQVCGVHQVDTLPYRFVSVSGPTSSTSNGKQVITSVVTTDNDGIRISHTVTYQPGEYRIRHDWKVENISSAPPVTYSGLALRFGGGCKLGGVNISAGGWDVDNRFLYCVRNDNGDSGRMGFQEIPGATFSGVVEGYGNDIINGLMIGGNNLPDPQARGTFIGYSSSDQYFTPFSAPNGMAVEWQHSSLLPGESFQVYTYERWIPTGSIQVVGPVERTARPGGQVTVDFQVTNLLNSYDQSVTFAAVPPTDWSTNALESPQTIAISDYVVVPVSLTSLKVPVTVTVPSNATAGTYYLSLEALGEITNSAQSSARAVVLNGASSDRIAITVEGNPTATVTAPAIPLSTGNRVIYTAISPSTSEGIDSVIAALSGRSTSITRAFAWNSSSQAYVEVPRVWSKNDIHTYTGIFIATREPLRYSLSGTSTTSPFTLTLKSGWTFAGIPPVMRSQTEVITKFAWQYPSPASTSTSPVLSISFSADASIIDAMGTTGSPNDYSSRPWFWNGSAYVQVDELEAGRGYWFKNNFTKESGYEITVTANGSVASALAAKSVGNRTATGTAVITRDLGAPPTMPNDTANSSEKSSSGSKCGTGSGVAGFALLSLMVVFGLRLRRTTRP